ncbi:MAG: beta-lactamase family protein [Myxococcota bacterium]|nr:beta-lactamase family protein [Myxococcota bacterium]
MAGHIARGEVPGLVTLVSRRGEVHVDAIGSAAIGGADPMRRDTLFRLASLTKPLVAAATMILVEECKLRLDDRIDRLLPELADRKVLKRIDGPLDDTVPARRPITVRDLLTQRFGFGLIMGAGDALPIEKAVSELGIMTLGPPKPAIHHGPDEWVRRLGTLPLMYHPGERWAYNTAFYVLGVLIARASCRPLETFLRERLFEPLGMKDTGFSVPAQDRDRLATCYHATGKAAGTPALEVHDGVEDSQWNEPPIFPDGAAGLVSTVDDYLAFGQMMLEGGKHGRERILSRLSVEAMVADQLTPEQKAVSGLVPGYWDNLGWGFGVGVVTRRDGIAAVPGRFGWDGGYGTSWASDPREGVVAILMTQRLGFPLYSKVRLDFWTSVYQAIDD